MALGLALPGLQGGELSPFTQALAFAERALESGDELGARKWIERALERDRKSTAAWDLRARWAAMVGDRDELVYARHREYGLAVGQGRKRSELKALRERLLELDPIAKDLLGMAARFVKKLQPIAGRYEQEGRPHAAIRVHKQILALDPEDTESQAAIDRIAAEPDPSLAGDAKPKDLFADVSEEWIREHDKEHDTWGDRAKLTRENYVTYTDAGYEVLIRAGEAMEQMNAFYRRFFKYGTKEYRGSVSRIELWIFKNRDEYLELGSSPAEWSAGQFTGGSVQTYVGDGGFESMTGVLFHEAAHQFVSLATSASGWLNEGLASFFEGTRILPNGTVIMNMPATHRLFPLVARMERGWMADYEDGTDPSDPKTTPDKAPTFRIILENKYSWGPPWYAPTWGLVYFLYNYQDPVDGRFVYRKAFQVFINKSGGRVGKGAIRNFEEVVLANPAPPIKGVERPDDAPTILLPSTTDDLDEVWKQWCTGLREEQQGRIEVPRPYTDWGRYATMNGDVDIAMEHFEKGLVADPGDVELLMSFADLLAGKLKNPDRAAKLVMEAIHHLEAEEEPDQKKIATAEKALSKLDPKLKTLAKVRDEMAVSARSIVQRYRAADLSMMVMDVSWKLGSNLDLPDLYDAYEEALRQSRKSLDIWSLAYDEHSLKGWNAAETAAWQPEGSALVANNGTFSEDGFDFKVLTLDKVTSGDFSMEAEIQAEKGEVNFCGFVFGRKGPMNLHGLILFPGRTVEAGVAESGFVDLTSFYGGSEFKVWRHVPVNLTVAEGRSATGQWRKLRLDVNGRNVDMWWDGELLSTHEFPSVDVLRGSFGLICGPGTARFKNIRYLARDPRDPGGRIVRDMRMAELEEQGGGAIGGSYLGRVPPFPSVARWVQGEPRERWDERGDVPQLLVFFSIVQNDMVRIDRWLMSLARKTRAIGLEFVCICEFTNDAELEAYLAEHPLPGSVGIDAKDPLVMGIGDSFEAYSIQRFNLPRVLLLDVDQTVAWEGDPGFVAGQLYDPDVPTFLAAPLEDLAAKRQLKAVAAWARAWEGAKSALHDGDVAAAAQVMLESKMFDRRYSKAVAEAQNQLDALLAAVDAIQMAGEAFQREGTEPAIEALVEWAPLVGREIPAKVLKRELKAVRTGRLAKQWKTALRLAEKIVTYKGKEPAERARENLDSMRALEGRFAQALTAELEEAVAIDAWDRCRRIVSDAPNRPRVWLAREYFGW